MSNTQSNLIHIDFTKPTALKLDDQIVLRDMWKTLGEPHGRYDKWVERKLVEHYENGNDYKTDKKVLLNNTEQIDHIVSIQTALEIAANGHGEMGNRVRKFFGACLRLLNEQNTLPDPIDVIEDLLGRFKCEREKRLVAEAQVVTLSVVSTVEQRAGIRETVANIAELTGKPPFVVYSWVKGNAIPGRALPTRAEDWLASDISTIETFLNGQLPEIKETRVLPALRKASKTKLTLIS